MSQPQSATCTTFSAADRIAAIYVSLGAAAIVPPILQLKLDAMISSTSPPLMKEAINIFNYIWGIQENICNFCCSPFLFSFLLDLPVDQLNPVRLNRQYLPSRPVYRQVATVCVSLMTQSGKNGCMMQHYLPRNSGLSRVPVTTICIPCGEKVKKCNQLIFINHQKTIIIDLFHQPPEKLVKSVYYHILLAVDFSSETNK
ncbi:MAG: hypothetical protein P0107_01665 [Nitrosomonas sp.]|nr:hypothetical protein [Nitrosomonas sp.]